MKNKKYTKLMIVISVFMVLTAAACTSKSSPQNDGEPEIFFDIPFFPYQGEILRLTGTKRGELRTFTKISRFVYNADTQKLGYEKMPESFFYLKNVPDIFHGKEFSYLEYYYLTMSNINDFSHPIKTEKTKTGTFEIFTAAAEYDDQVLNYIIASKMGQPNNLDVQLVCSSCILSDTTYDYTDANLIENNIRASRYNRVTYCAVDKYTHPLFDNAYIVNFKVDGMAFDHWEFFGFKTMEHPISYLSFDNNTGKPTKKNLESFLVTGDVMVFNFGFLPLSKGDCAITLTKDSFIEMVDGIGVK